MCLICCDWRSNSEKVIIGFRQKVLYNRLVFVILALNFNEGYSPSTCLVFFVIPAEAGIQTYCVHTASLDSGLRRNDGVWSNLSTDWDAIGVCPTLGGVAEWER